MLMRVQDEAESRRDFRSCPGARKQHIPTLSLPDEPSTQRRKKPAHLPQLKRASEQSRVFVYGPADHRLTNPGDEGMVGVNAGDRLGGQHSQRNGGGARLDGDVGSLLGRGENPTAV